MLTRLPAIILVNREASGSDLRSVCIDDEAGARCATQHLLRNGRRTISSWLAHLLRKAAGAGRKAINVRSRKRKRLSIRL